MTREVSRRLRPTGPPGMATVPGDARMDHRKLAPRNPVLPVPVTGLPGVPGTARASDRSPRRPAPGVAPWPAGERRDRVGHRVPGHWAALAYLRMLTFCAETERAVRATKEAQSEPSSVSSRDACQCMFGEAVTLFRWLMPPRVPKLRRRLCLFRSILRSP